MTEPHDPNRTVDAPSTPVDNEAPDLNRTVDIRAGSLDARLAAGLSAPRSTLGVLRPMVLQDVPGESIHVVESASDAMPAPELSGDRYQLFGEIARGGMGAVLRGRDVDLGRDLAVKVLLQKHADQPEVLRRFIEEAQIGGQLQHPGVVPVYDVGRFGEVPFFTMKLVEGKTLAALLGERADPAADRPRFLAIALQVAQTVAYAHARGVIHRDLKPGNIMVGAFGEVQVMDWGLAKVLVSGEGEQPEQASRERQRPEEGTAAIRTARSSAAGSLGAAGSFGTQTQAGALLGTPAYMPPEQARGDIALLDRRADVFSLGAILCEVLTGKPPYVGVSYQEICRKAAGGDLTDTCARLEACGADAELIALTRACLAAEPADRPRDAQAVADALTAYLDGVQERLRQAELAEAAARAKAVEEAKRRRLTVALSATVLLAVTLGGGGWLWLKADRDARQAQVVRDVNDALNQATLLREQSKTGSADAAARLAQAREQAQRAQALVASGPADAVLVDRVAQLQAELDEEEKDRQLVAALNRARLAQAATVVSENRFAHERAVPVYREAFRAYGLVVGQGDPAAAARRLSRRPAGVRQAALAALEQWAELATNPTFPVREPHAAWLVAVVEAAEPADSWTRQFRAARAEKEPARRRAALHRMAESADVANLPADALTTLAWRLAGVGSMARAVQLLRQARRQHRDDFWINHDLGKMLSTSRPTLAEAVRYLTAAAALRPDSPGALINLGGALYELGEQDEAIACCRRAIELDRTYAPAHTSLGAALRVKGELGEAIACLRQAIELDPRDWVAHTNLGAALADQGKLDEAIVCWRRAVAGEPRFAGAHANLGHALRAKGDLEGAIAAFRQAVTLSPRSARAHQDLGMALDQKGNLEEAFSSFEKVIDLEPRNAVGHINLGWLLQKQGKLAEAEKLYRKAVELDPRNAWAHHNLAWVLDRQGKLAEAEKHYRQAIVVDSSHAGAHTGLGSVLSQQDRLVDAEGSFHRAIDLDPRHARAHHLLGRVLHRQGKFAEAEKLYGKALVLDPNNRSTRINLGIVRRVLAVEAKLPALLEGKYRPQGNDERLALVTLCHARWLYRATARLYVEAFAADAKLAEDLQEAHRYNAACAAAGQGEDAPQTSSEERLALRRQALTWLRADLARRTRQLQGGQPASRSAVLSAMRHWERERAFAGLRDRAALEKLSAEERAACLRLWADVAALRTKADSSSTKEFR
jgi:serine/threonine-protein kinase